MAQGEMDEEALRRWALCRLSPSRVGVGDKVVVLTGGSGGNEVDRKWGHVKEVVKKRLAVVQCKTTNHKAYPLSYTEFDCVVPLSCCFSLAHGDSREEFIFHCIERHYRLKEQLGEGLGDNDEIFLNVARHLVGYCQSLLVFSGYRQKTFANVFCRHFSTTRAYWLQASKLPSPRIDSAVMYPLPGSVVFAGGVDDHPSVGSPLKTAVSYDSLTGEWIKLPSMNIRRHGCCGVAHRGRLYVFGGAHAEVASTRTITEEVENGLPFYEYLDVCGASDQGAGAAGPGWVQGAREHLDIDTMDRIFASCGVVGGKIVLAGGEIPRASSSVRNRYTFEYRLHTVFEVVRECESFDPETEEWGVIPSMADARVGAAYCTWNGRLVVAGGQNEHKQTLSTVEVFDGEKWTRMPDLNQGRFHASMTVWNGVLTVIGGSFEENQDVFSPGKVPTVVFTDKVEQFSTKENKWVICHKLRMPVSYHACVAASLNVSQF
ncbi:hypothetical protein HOP50_09g55840 [Chloropicon primus]|nr:hypothetical protein HOP50_09g55840 [Chloropicon primus]